MDPSTLLIVEDDQDLLTLLARSARGAALPHARGVDARRRAAGDRRRRVRRRGRRSHARRATPASTRSARIKERAPDTEIIVISGTTSLATAIASYELKAFALRAQAVRRRAAVHAPSSARSSTGRSSLANRRLVWEQRLVNEIGDELRHLLAPEQLVERVLRRLMRGLGVDASAARLLNPETSEYDLRVISAPDDGPPDVGGAPRRSCRARATCVLATRAPVRIDDVHDGARRRRSGAHCRCAPR